MAGTLLGGFVVAKPSMRALASALIALTATCFGQGVGPPAVGVVNDALKGSHGADAVRYSCSRPRSRRRWAPCCSCGRRGHPRRHRAGELALRRP